MRTLRWLMAVLLLGAGMTAHAQYARWDSPGATTAIGTGTYIPLYAIPGAGVSFYTGCTTLPCMTKAVTYTGPTGSACSSTTQVVLQTSSTCVSSADPQGNFGAWLASGAYQYTLTVKGVTSGPYYFNAGSGGTGGATSVGLVMPAALCTVTGSPVTTSGTLTCTAVSETANTFYAGPATGSAAAPAFRALVAADLAGVTSYQTVALGGTSQTQRPVLNFASQVFTTTDSASPARTTVGINLTGNGTVVLTGAGAYTPGDCLQVSNTGTNAVDAGVACGSSGSGSVTSFGSGNAAPFFTTSVANSTTTPVLSFSISNAPANTVFGNNTGSTGAPGYVLINTGMLPYSYVGNTALLITGSGSYVSGNCLQINSSLNAIGVTCPSAGAGPPASPIGSLQINAGSGNLGSYTSSGLVKIVSGSPTSAAQGVDYLGAGLCTVAGATSITLDGTTCSSFLVTMGAAVSTVTLANFVTNQYYAITFKENGTGGYTCANPTGGIGFTNCSVTANAHTKYFSQYDGTNLVAQSAGIIY